MSGADSYTLGPPTTPYTSADANMFGTPQSVKVTEDLGTPPGTATAGAERYGNQAASQVHPASVPTRTSSSFAVNGHAHPPHSPPRKSSLNAVHDHAIRETSGSGRKSASNPHRHTYHAASSSTKHHSPFEPLRTVGNDYIHQPSAPWSTEKEKILFGPFDYLHNIPGKDIRSQLISAFDAYLSVPPASLSIITNVVGMLHTASLLVDDVEDSSTLRRGVPVAHNIFGTAQTINSANYVYFAALQELLRLHNPAAVTIYTDELLNLHRGQGMDLFWRDTLTCPTEADYLEMVGNKTGGLFRLAVKLMQAESQTPRVDMLPLVNTIGLLFQILDDYRNLTSSAYEANKGFCEDLTEGKFSFPIIHAIRSDPSNLVLINVLKQKTLDIEVKRYAVAYMERVGSFSYTRRVLRGLHKKAVGLVEEVDRGEGIGEAITGILDRMKVERSAAGHQRAESEA